MINKKDIPNFLTYSRVVAVPLLAVSFYFDEPLNYWFSSIIFFYAAVSDFFDGYFARKWNIRSDMGRVLDPIADKLIVAIALIYLVDDWRVSEIAVSIIMFREILIAGIREYMAEKAQSIHVSVLAKYKTTSQMIAVQLLLLGDIAPRWVIDIGEMILWIAVILTVITGYQYVKNTLGSIEK